MAIPIVKNGIIFSPYRFYNDFLGEYANYYATNKTYVEFRLIDSNDEDAFWGVYRIDPIVIPLLLSLSAQLKKFYHHPIKLHLFNNRGTKALLEYLYYSNFFHIIGDNTNPAFPIGKKLFDFDERYLGGFSQRDIRQGHKIRAYSKKDDKINDNINIEAILNSNYEDEEKRDYLVEYYYFKVREHFEELLFDDRYELSRPDLFIDILSELISNGIMHSESDVFASMFADINNTKFSISDNGIGFAKSLEKKDYSKELFYKHKELTNQLKLLNTPFKVPIPMKENLYSLFEALFYSITKRREGLFDLMCNVVLGNNGRFRIHTEYTQIIISNNMYEHLQTLYKLRQKILLSYFENIEERNTVIAKLANEALKLFEKLYEITIRKYNENIIYSSIRFNRVGFNGVHIEVEIPNNKKIESSNA